VQRGHLNVPVIGVANGGWNLEQLRQRAGESLEKHGGVDDAAYAKLCKLSRYLDGDYEDPHTFLQGRKELADSKHPSLSCDPAKVLWLGRTAAGAFWLRECGGSSR
jgi:glucose-6-phosphate 1-dehydrogenase